MRSTTSRLRFLLTGIGAFFIGGDLLAQEPAGRAGAADFADHRSPAQAQVTTISTADPSAAGLIGYLGAQTKLDSSGKLVLADVLPDSPAAKAGLLVGDEVTAADGKPVSKPETFRTLIRTRAPGSTLKLAVKRNGQTVETTATLAALSRPMKAATGGTPRPTLGLLIGDMNEGVGAPVEQVLPGSPAERAKLKVGDLLQKVDGIAVNGPAKLRELLAEKKPDDSVTLTVRTADKISDVKVALGGAAPGQGSGVRAGRGFSGPAPLWKGENFRLAVVRIEYPDIKHNKSVSTKDWEQALFSKGEWQNKNGPTGEPVHGSLNDYWLEQSSGSLRLSGKVFDWVELGKKRADYLQGSGTSNKTVPLAEALEKLTSRDGKEALKDFDGFFFVYAGEPVRGNRGSLYAPHSGSLTHQGKRYSYLLTPEGGPKLTPLGGYCREFGFMLGLPDLGGRTENAGVESAGVWCLMSSPFATARPQHLCAWSKEKLGWLKPAVIDPTVKQKLVLAPIEGSKAECFKVLAKPDGSEYFLLENRRKQGFDLDLPGEGLLVWRVGGDRPTLEESHGVEGASGPRLFLSAVPFPSIHNSSFTPETIPSSRSPSGGGLPVWITGIRRLPDGRVNFQIGYEYR